MTPGEVDAALRCRAVNRAGFRCRLGAPHLGQKHLPETPSAAVAAAADLDDPSDDVLERAERRDDELRQEER